MKKICLMREKLQQAGQEKNLVPGSKNVLEAAEQAFQAAPEAKSVARSLLEQLVPHALLLLSSEARWIDAQCGEIIELGRRVDRLAERPLGDMFWIWIHRIYDHNHSMLCDCLMIYSKH